MLAHLLLPLLLLAPFTLADPTPSDLDCTTWFSADCDVQNTAVGEPGPYEVMNSIFYNAQTPTTRVFNSILCNRDLKDNETLDVSIVPAGFDLVTGKDGAGHFPGKATSPDQAKCAMFERKTVQSLSKCYTVPGTCYQLNTK